MKKVVKRMVVGVVCITMLMPGIKTVCANNWTNSSFTVAYSGDGSDFAIKARRKTDNTYTYVKINSGAKFQFAAQAKNGINDGDWGNPFICDYTTSWYTLGVGKCTYIPNKAHKKGFSATYLSVSSSDHKAHTYKGVWSPDNTLGFGEP